MTREELNQEKQLEILAEQQYERRKKIIIFAFKIIVILVVVFLGFYLYTTFVSTKMLVVREERIVSEKLPANFSGLKVVQFSDLHYGTTVFYSDVKHTVKKINERNPDLVVFTGDLIDSKYDLTTVEQEKLSSLLKTIDTKLGKYAIAGEEDSDVFETIMKQAGFIILDNSYELIYNDTNEPILLVGLSSMLADRINIDNAFSYFKDATHNTNIYTLLLTHEPDAIDDVLNDYSADLILAGHSHNGNIRLPVIGAIYKVEGAKKYHQAHYEVDGAELFISGGIGTNGPGFRLFCHPSINFFRISEK